MLAGGDDQAKGNIRFLLQKYQGCRELIVAVEMQRVEDRVGTRSCQSQWHDTGCLPHLSIVSTWAHSWQADLPVNMRLWSSQQVVCYSPHHQGRSSGAGGAGASSASSLSSGASGSAAFLMEGWLLFSPS